ncbi:DUF721 domain-containing protein [Nitrosococcus wardiae]|uniref:DUF721 domain-containing protein n=2 Tax=Nitrosococcus wardiae TaxID=1814290 RepID=A0A4P7BU67_9GAMM|nr:DUF721 domain-containing protein [Nitrosococcus wardiae]
MQVTQSIGKLLDTTEGNLQRLLARAKALQQLTVEVRQCLPKALSPHCLVANIRDHRLIIHTDTAARANLLRYYTPSIIKHLQQHQELRNLRKVTVKVRPPHLLTTSSQAQRPVLSPANGALLRNIASGMKDPHLKSAFLRLSRRTNP